VGGGTCDPATAAWAEARDTGDGDVGSKPVTDPGASSRRKEAFGQIEDGRRAIGMN
jgi:hypothetical protein